MKTIYVDYIHVLAGKGTTLHECLREAGILMLTEQRDVIFVFNEVAYFLKLQNTIDFLAASQQLPSKVK